MRLDENGLMRIPSITVGALLIVVASGATLTINPPVISSCIHGLGVATLTWAGATGSPQIRVGQANGTAMTGVLGASGSADTGLWVTDGLAFYLVDQTGQVEASATAQVKCGSATPTVVDQGLGSGSYFPLAVGTTWVYKYKDRSVTANYRVETITGQQAMGGQIYYVLSETTTSPPITLGLFRADGDGVIYQYSSSGDQVYLDPKSAGVAMYSGALGVFNDTITLSQIFGGVILTTSTYARGIGLISFQSVMETGSSGGFTEGMDLVDVQVDGFRLSLPAPKIGLSIENTTLDLTNQAVPNCAVPCYFVACGLVPGTDPAGTYRPCAQTRIETSGATAGYTLLLELLDSNGRMVIQNLTQSPLATHLEYVRLPLYIGSTPFTLLPPGNYTLVGNMTLAGATVASASIGVQVK
jgi:hypothetical protein